MLYWLCYPDAPVTLSSTRTSVDRLHCKMTTLHSIIFKLREITFLTKQKNHPVPLFIYTYSALKLSLEIILGKLLTSSHLELFGDYLQPQLWTDGDIGLTQHGILWTLSKKIINTTIIFTLINIPLRHEDNFKKYKNIQ